MKIAHLNTHSYGGAAVVARRLHRAGLAAGIDSRLITKFGVRRDKTPNYMPLRNGAVRYFLRRQSANPGLYRIGKTLQRLTEHPSLAGRQPGFEIFSPLNTRQHYYDCTDDFAPDIIHLHWVAGFVDHEKFFEHNRLKKFVWTLHDMNPFTGGCHHSDNCMGFAGDCRACPQLAGTRDASYASQVFTAKNRSLRWLSDDQVVIVTPSRWLYELSVQSKITRRFAHVQINNPSLEQADDAVDRMQLRHALGLPSDKKIVLFAADNLRNPRKGIALLFAAVQLLPRKKEVHLVGLGQGTDAPAGLPVTFVGSRLDEGKLQRYYACADLVVNASVVENASLVIIEALSCGTPVVAFDTGGTPELVNENCGLLAKSGDVRALADAIAEALFRRHFCAPTIKAAAAVYSLAAVWQQYQNVYMDLLA